MESFDLTYNLVDVNPIRPGRFDCGSAWGLGEYSRSITLTLLMIMK